MTSDTVPFGKYKGRPVEDMLADADYMVWLEAQPWFRERFKHISARRDADAMSRTPVHNRLQTLFLDEDYCRAFLGVAAQSLLANAREDRSACPIVDRLRCHATFEDRGADVRIFFIYASDEWVTEHRNWALIGYGDRSVSLEIKPSVADEYPAVLRQMTRNNSGFLFVGSYEGEGASEAQFHAMFAASGKRVVFKRDVDAEAARWEPSIS